MAVALLLLAAAVVVAPWTPVASHRLATMAESSRPPSTGTHSRGPTRLTTAASAIRAASWLSAGIRHALIRLIHGSGAAPDPGTLAQLVDLLAAALTAGLPAADALAAVADALESSHPDLADPLRSVSARMRLGATPDDAWRDVPGSGPLAPVSAVLVRACQGGGSVRSALHHAADRMRSEADAAATARAERAAVMVAGPLGLCFLPAFVCLGVLPMVMGLADGMLPGSGAGLAP